MASNITPEIFRKQLAVAVKNIEWSYAIFWSISSTQPGVLEWGDGYYNGEVMTRKTIKSIEINTNESGLQRSGKLRELYKSLSTGEANPQARRPTAALSPDDLTDTEWYYLVCMSFTFDIGQGLPGRSLANCQTIWLCQAHDADSKSFTRSLLAKSASIQTVVCFPLSGGVIELGVTDLVLEDPKLIQHVKTSFLEISFPIAATNTSTNINNELATTTFDHETLEAKFNIPIAESEEIDVVLPINSSDNQPAEDSFIIESIYGVACQDDPDSCHTDDNLHYQGVLLSLLKTSHPFITGQRFQNCDKASSFVAWKKRGLINLQKSEGRKSQNMLKKILIQVPRMHVNGLPESWKDRRNTVGGSRQEAEDIGMSHELVCRKRKGKLGERIMILKSIVPSINKVDEVSILDDTIIYLQKLEKRIENLESCRKFRKYEARTRRKAQNAIEGISDSHGSNKISNKDKLSIKKRRACEIDEPEPEVDNNSPKEGSDDRIIVGINDDDVVIEIKCPWREGLLLEIIDATSHLKLNSVSIQSSTINGILSLTIKSKHKGYSELSAWEIKQAIQRIAGRC